MSNILAALGVVQMKKLDRMNDARRVHAAAYNQQLSAEFFDLPVEKDGRKHVYQMYTLKLKNVDRTKFLADLRGLGIVRDGAFRSAGSHAAVLCGAVQLGGA